MTNRTEVLFESDLGQTGRKLTFCGLLLLAFWAVTGYFVCFISEKKFLVRLFPLAIFMVGAIVFIFSILRTARMWRNSGVYKISIDDFGIDVTSTDLSIPSFSVVATDIACLVRKTIKNYGEGSDEQKFYIETKSGRRHLVEPLFTNYNLNTVKLFDRIIDRFHWVEIIEETALPE